MMSRDFLDERVEQITDLNTPLPHTTSNHLSTDPARAISQHLRFISIPLSSHLLKVVIEVDAKLVQHLESQTIELFRNNNIEGFDRQATPAAYLEEIFRSEINTKIKQYIFYHLVIDFLINELASRKINAANYPRLSSIEVTTEKKLGYHFDVSIADELELKEWKLFAFKPPKRKRYKDLDKQVISFIESRQATPKKNNKIIVEEHDWILFDALLYDQKLQPVSSYFNNSFWFRIGRQDVSEPFVAQLLGKEIDSSLITTHLTIQQQSQKNDALNYNFLIIIKAIVKGSYLSLETFKTTFKLKNKADIHNKLMEVFSFRNDVSQRKAIIEEIFHLLLSKHRFEVPKHLVLRREEDIIRILSQQTDYHVYKAQKDFDSFVEMLAEKQLKEEILIDQIASNENIKVDIKDISQYLHLISNKRLKEFIYFKPLLEKIEESSNPINTSTIMQSVLREKTLNYIIYTLTR